MISLFVLHRIHVHVHQFSVLWGVKDVSSSESRYACWCLLPLCSIGTSEHQKSGYMYNIWLFCFVLFQISGWETCCCFQQCLITSAITQLLCAQWGTMTLFFFFFFFYSACRNIRLFFCRKIALFQIKPSRAFEIPLSIPGWSKRMAIRYSLWENILLFYISLF